MSMFQSYFMGFLRMNYLEQHIHKYDDTRMVETNLFLLSQESWKSKRRRGVRIQKVPYSWAIAVSDNYHSKEQEACLSEDRN